MKTQTILMQMIAKFANGIQPTGKRHWFGTHGAMTLNFFTVSGRKFIRMFLRQTYCLNLWPWIFGPGLKILVLPWSWSGSLFARGFFYTEFFKECTSNFKTVKQAKILGIGRYRYFDSFYSVISKIFRYSSIWQGINIVSNIEKSLENTPSLAGYHYKTAFLL